jgi:hypothetical protein
MGAARTPAAPFQLTKPLFLSLYTIPYLLIIIKYNLK